MAADEPKPDADGPRGVRLRDAILALFPRSATELRVTLNRGAPDEFTRTVTRDTVRALGSDAAGWPDLRSIEAYAVKAGWTFEQAVADLGADKPPRLRRDFADLPAHRALLRSNLTSIEPGPLPTLRGTHIQIPIAMGQAVPYVTGPLQSLIFPGRRESVAALARASPRSRFTARVGDCENAAYPRLPARALVRVDRLQTAVSPARLFLLQYPRGLICCGAEAQGGHIVIVPDPGSGSQAERFPREAVQVLGRATAMAARVGQRLPPVPPGVTSLGEAQAASSTRSSHPAKVMLIDNWRRHAHSYGAHARDERRRAALVLGGKRGQAIGTLHSYLRESDAHVPMPNFETFYRLAAGLDVDYQALLRAFGISPAVLADRGPADGADEPLAAITRLRTHPFGAYLEGLGWDLPWLCALLAQVEEGTIYHLGALFPGWGPLLKPGAFIVVDERRRRIPRAPVRANGAATSGRARVLERRDWERPMFLLSTSAGPHFLCGYCERRGDSIRAVPHPGDDADASREFRIDEEVRVLGRVTHVATLL